MNFINVWNWNIHEFLYMQIIQQHTIIKSIIVDAFRISKN